MRHDIVDVGELLGHEYIRVLPCKTQGSLQTFVDAGADVAGVMHQLHMRTIVAHQLPSLFADGIGHDNDGLVAFDGTDEGKTDALIAAGGFHDDGIFVEQAFFFSL